MNLLCAIQIPRWRQRVAGVAVAVLALVFLSSVTQANAHHRADGQAAENQLEHLVVASHNPALAVLKPDPRADNNVTGDTPESLTALLMAPFRLPPPTAVVVTGRPLQTAVATPYALAPPLRAPPAV
ncbi:MAG TPA: hypothetical protein VKY53_02660 [Marinobacter sp.]|nr:hypothetical protein [Marinobacter sp.]